MSSIRFRVVSVSKILVAALLSLAVFSCQDDKPVNELILQKTSVSKYTGRVFVELNTEVSWSLECDFMGEEPWAKFSKTSGTGSTKSVIMKYDDNNSKEARTMRVIANFSDGSNDVVEFSQRGDIAGGEGTVLPPWEETPDLKSDVMTGWMELPSVIPTDGDETKITGCAWVYHNMTFNSSLVRNYSIFYDAINFMPRWVAYPLNNALRGSGQRTDDWMQKDPKIPLKYQPYVEKGWGHGGYDRGHMLPSNDRLRDAANRATFYPTNMTMQNSNLNQNSWAVLEGQTRTWASQCDTLYVVVGAVPSGRFLRDRGGNRVNVPASYYRVLLSYKKNRDPEYAGIAFEFDNTSTSDSYKTHKMTVRELEEKVNINFFVNLPSQYDKAETEINPSVWTNIN